MKSVKRRITGLAARLWSRPSLTPERLRTLQPRRILLVRQHNQMGDMVCATPGFRAIRQAWPGAEIALVTAPVNREVVAHNPHLDRVLVFEQRLWRQPLALWRFLGTLRTFDADLALVLNSVSFSATSAFLALWSGARWVVGGDSAPFGSPVASAYSLRLPASPAVERHAVDHSLAPLAAVGIATDDRDTVVVPAPAQCAEARRLRVQSLPEGAFWALHPGAGKAQNVWPPARFAAVAAAVAARGIPVLVLHGPADRPQLEAFARALALAPGAAPVVVAPAVSVGTGAALIGEAERFLCNDTGVMHVAGAVGTPTLALFGPTDPSLWKPPAPAVVALRAPRREPDPRGPEYGWMESLSTDEVLAAWLALAPLPAKARGPLPEGRGPLEQPGEGEGPFRPAN
jgi:ADP-heptose:LPS heptosyltransferase